jgi:hypothetical protein
MFCFFVFEDKMLSFDCSNDIIPIAILKILSVTHLRDSKAPILSMISLLIHIGHLNLTDFFLLPMRVED